MKQYRVDLEQMLNARERRAAIQSEMLQGADGERCLVCLTLNIAGDVKRTPMTRMLFDHGMAEFESLGFRTIERRELDEVTGSEAFRLLDEEGGRVKAALERLEDSFPAARLYDFDVILPGGEKLSRAESRRCLICGGPAAACARSRRHGLAEVKKATDDLLKDFCASKLAGEAHGALLDELYAAPKPGLVDPENNGAHSDMDIALFVKSAAALFSYFEDAARMGMERRGMDALRERGIKAEAEMFAATGGVNTHKGLIYTMGLLLAGEGMRLSEGEGSCTEFAAALAAQDAELQLKKSLAAPDTNGGAAYRDFGARGATGEAAAGFPDVLYCLSRLRYYGKSGSTDRAVLALCDCMARLEDTNLLHRGGRAGLEYVKNKAARIAALPQNMRIEALREFDTDLSERGLSPGGSADMLAAAFLLERLDRLRTECSGEA